VTVIKIFEQLLTLPLIVFSVVLIRSLCIRQDISGIKWFFPRRLLFWLGLVGVLFGTVRLVRIEAGVFDWYYCLFFGFFVIVFCYSVLRIVMTIRK
jgi:hypothetical protein